MSLAVLRRARLDGYAGGKSALYEPIHSIRPKAVRLMTRFEGLPGEFSQHDFGQVDVHFLNGTKKRVHFFASRMKYSRWADHLQGSDAGRGRCSALSGASDWWAARSPPRDVCRPSARTSPFRVIA